MNKQDIRLLNEIYDSIANGDEISDWENVRDIPEVQQLKERLASGNQISAQDFDEYAYLILNAANIEDTVTEPRSHREKIQIVAEILGMSFDDLNNQIEDQDGQWPQKEYEPGQ